MSMTSIRCSHGTRFTKYCYECSAEGLKSKARDFPYVPGERYGVYGRSPVAVAAITGDDDNGTIRQFETGATRDTAEDKPDYEGFLTPEFIIEFGKYMHKNRLQQDGTLRDGDNWQKGIPLSVYIKSLWRHFIELWTLHRSGGSAEEKVEACCAIVFNVQGYLFETLKEKRKS